MAAPVADEAAPARWTLIAVTVGFLGLFLLAPLLVVAVEASRKGWGGYLSALADPDACAALMASSMTKDSASMMAAIAVAPA